MTCTISKLKIDEGGAVTTGRPHRECVFLTWHRKAFLMNHTVLFSKNYILLACSSNACLCLYCMIKGL